MTTPIDSPRTRRSLLRTAAAGAAGVAVGVFARPGTALGTTGTMVFGGINNAGTADTWLTSANSLRTLYLANDGLGKALEAEAVGISAIAVYGHGPIGYGVLGDTGTFDQPGAVGVWGRDSGGNGAPRVGAAGSSTGGTGLVGYVHTDAINIAPPTYELGVGVYGFAPTGTGVVARSVSGTAIKVVGKASFSRSGRVSLPKGKSYVDVDLSAKGGLASSPLAFATILTRRPGVHVETVRLNYPSAGKLRIDLNRVASSTTNTTLCWVVLG